MGSEMCIRDRYALSEKTQKRVLELVPRSSFNDLQKSIQQLQEFWDIRETERGFPALDFEDLEEEIRFLKIKNAVIPLVGILKIHQASYLNNTIHVFFVSASKLVLDNFRSSLSKFFCICLWVLRIETRMSLS